MEAKHILAIFLIIAVVIALLLTPREGPIQTESAVGGEFSPIGFGRAGEIGYLMYNIKGSGSLTLLTLTQQPEKNIAVLNDKGIGTDRFDEFIDRLLILEKYGYRIKVVSSFSKIKDGIVLVPTGAMPLYFLDAIGKENTTILYIGSKELILSEGTKRRNWYDELSPEQRSRLIVRDTTIDELLDKGMEGLLTELIENSWAVKERKEIWLKGDGDGTATINMRNTSYVRAIWDFGDHKGLFDSPAMPPQPVVVKSEKESFFPWEHTILEFDIEKSNGTAYMVIEKNGFRVRKEQLRRVTEGNVFIKKLSLSEPGVYIIKIVDNSGQIGGGSVHVKNLSITLSGVRGNNYIFTVNVDGKAPQSTRVGVSLNNGTAIHEFYLSNGQLTIPAKLRKGQNTFHFSIFGTVVDFEIKHEEEGVIDVYTKYGIPGLLLVALVYIGARAMRKPVYRIRTTDEPREIRGEVRISLQQAKELFRTVRSDLGLTGPITAHEYAIGLKRYITEGADVSDGNVEQLLKKMVKAGVVESHKGFYQLSGEGNVKRAVLKRIATDELIKRGIPFRRSGEKLITANYEIGFFGDRFNKKAIIIFEDEHDMATVLNNLDKKQKAALEVQRFNGVVELVTVDQLGEML